MNCAGGYVWSYPSSSCIPYNQYSQGYGYIQCISGTYWNGVGCIQYPTYDGCGGYGGCNNNNNDDTSIIIIIINNTNKNNNNKKNNYCVNGLIWNGYCCVDSGKYDCDAGEYWDGNNCKKSREDKYNKNCPKDSFWNGRKCEVYKKTGKDTQCEDGHYWFNPGKTCAVQQPINVCGSCKR